MRSVPVRLWTLALFSACLQAIPYPFAGPVPAWRRAFCYICLTPLVFCLTRTLEDGKALSLRQGLALGYVCGVAWYLTNCYWIYPTMYHYGGLHPIAAAGVLLLFSLYLGLYHALFSGTLVHLRNRFGVQVALLICPFLWTAVELARSRVTGFPWDLLGYTQVDHLSLGPLAALTGAMGVSFVVACVNCLFLVCPRSTRRRTCFLGSGIALVVIAGISVADTLYRPTPEAGKRTAVLLQDNLSVGAERGPAVETKSSLLESFITLSLHPIQAGPPQAERLAPRSVPLPRPPEIIAWAEAPTNFWSADPDIRRAAGFLAQEAHAPVVVDAATAENPGTDAERHEFVSAAFFSADGKYLGRYDKMHLVPFGEYVPYKPLFFFAGHLLDGLDFSPGAQRRVLDDGAHRFGVFICYESVFGDEVRQFARMGAQVFVNLSDDGWYGDTSAPWEHLDMVRMRAIENRRWVLRATNTGVTASIDPEGRIVSALPRHIRAALAAPFEYREDTTFYTRHGDWFGWVCVVFVAVLLVASFFARRPASLRSSPGKIN